MAIAYNPTNGLSFENLSKKDSFGKDIIFDLLGKSVYAKGTLVGKVYQEFQKSTSSTTGLSGLVPFPDYNGDSETRFLREDGTWVVPTNTNNYRPISVNGTSILGNNNTALNLVAGTNITLNPKKDSNNKYTGEVTITASNPAWNNITGKPTTLAGYGIKDAFTWKRNITSTTTDDNALWGEIGIQTYVEVLPDGLTGQYNYGVLASFNNNKDSSSQFQLYASDYRGDNTTNRRHIAWRTGHGANKGTWQRLANIDTKNIFTESQTFQKQIKSTIATGTAPFSVASTTLVTNLNADMLDGKHLNDILNSNAASSTKLQTARKIWGQSFDGTADVSGGMTGVTSIENRSGLSIVSNELSFAPENAGDLKGVLTIGGSINYGLAIWGDGSGKSYLQSGRTDEINAAYNLIIQHLGGNVGIGTTSPTEKLQVNGNVKATSFLGNLDGSYINKLTGYTKATTISNITANDTLNAALGKLELKADTAYELVKGAYDGDGTIENLAEILKVLEGISDTDTIKSLLGKYRRLDKDEFYDTEVHSKFWINKAIENGGGWAYPPILVFKADKETTLLNIGVYGNNSDLIYNYIGNNDHNSTKNLRIYPDGTVTAPVFNGNLNYTNLTGSTTTANQAIVSNGTKDGWKLLTLGPGAFLDDYPMLNLGTLSDYVEYVLLLHPINGSTDLQLYYSYGTIYTHRSNGLSPCSSIIYNSISKYNSTDVYVSMVLQGRKYAQWCTCTYNRLKYCGLKLYTKTNHSSNLTIKGRWNSGPVLVKYKTNSNGNITSKEIIHNEEIANSIVVEGDDIIIKSTHGKFNGTFEGNITGGTVGSVLYQSTADITSFLNPPSTESILTSKGGVPYWTSLVSVRGYIGTTPVQSTSANQALTGITSLSMSDNINILSGNSDRYITFGYSNNAFTSADAYSWRLGYIGSGENNANYFKIQSSHGNTWTDVLKLGLLTYEATFSGNVIASGNVTASGDIILKNSGINAATPYLKFQRGSMNDSYIDWRLGNNNSGKLILQYNYNDTNATTETWNDVFVTTRTVSTFNSALEVAGSLLTLGNSNGSTLLFKRPSASYIWADEPGGYFAIGVKDTGTTSIDNASLLITKEFIQPGRRNNKVYLGNSSYRWANVFSVLGNFSGNVTASKFITTGGTASQFVKGDGSLDSTSYISTTTLENYVTKTEFPNLSSKGLYKNLTSSGSSNINKWKKFARINLSSDKVYTQCGGYMFIYDHEGHRVKGILDFHVRTEPDTSINNSNINLQDPYLKWHILDSSNYASNIKMVKVENGIFDLYITTSRSYSTFVILVFTPRSDKITLFDETWIDTLPENVICTSSYTITVPNATTATKLANTLTFSAGNFTSKTYNGSSAVTVNIPTHTSHLTNDSFAVHNNAVKNVTSLTRSTLGYAYNSDANADTFWYTTGPVSVIGVFKYLCAIQADAGNNNIIKYKKVVNGSAQESWKTFVNSDGTQIGSSVRPVYVKNDGSVAPFTLSNATANDTRNILVGYDNGIYLVTSAKINPSTGILIANGFVKSNSSDSHVLLGAGGHKAISDFLLKSEIANQELSANLTTITIKSLAVTTDWMDTGIIGSYKNESNTLVSGDLETGTYIVQVYCSGAKSGGTSKFYNCYWSGVMSWYSGTNSTNSLGEDEILLHRSGHADNNCTIYLRTKLLSGCKGLKLLIAANQAMDGAEYTFKFKRVI